MLAESRQEYGRPGGIHLFSRHIYDAHSHDRVGREQAEDLRLEQQPTEQPAAN